MIKYRKVNVAGPSTFSYYVKDDKHVILFGEFHKESVEHSPTDYEIGDYIQDIFNLNKDKSFDVFLEDRYVMEGNTYKPPIESFGIESIKNTFENCFEFDKSKCNRKGNRFHYIDVRNLLNYYDMSNKMIKMFNHPDVISMKFFLENFSYDVLYASVSELEHKLLNRKEYNTKIKNYNDIRQFIYSMKRAYFSKSEWFDFSKKNWAAEFKNAIRKYPDYQYVIVKNVANRIIAIIALVMDFYLLLRLSKWYIKNSIIYAGENHVRTYRKFLEFDGYSLVSENWSFDNIVHIPIELINPIKMSRVKLLTTRDSADSLERYKPGILGDISNLDPEEDMDFSNPPYQVN